MHILRTTTQPDVSPGPQRDAYDAQRLLLRCDDALDAAKHEVMRLRLGWGRGLIYDSDAIASAEDRVRRAREARQVALHRWLSLR
jgi:hypothetical protein